MLTEAPALFVPVLRQLERDSERYFGVPQATVRSLEHTHREFSDLLRIRVSLPAGSIDAFVKVARPKGGSAADRDQMARRVADSFDTTLNLHQALFGATGVSTVRPIACFPEHLALITEQAVGTTLLERVTSDLRRGRPDQATEQLESAMARLGCWLRAYQASAPATERFDLPGAHEYLDVRLRRLVANPRSGISPGFREALLARAARTAAAVPPEDLAHVPVHADFALSNVLVHGDRVTVLDFDMAARGNRYHDLSHLYMQLDLVRAKPWIRPGGLDRLQRGLLRGFEAGMDARGPLFQLMLLQHAVCHLERLIVQAEGPIARLYSVRQQKRHHRWLQAFVEQPEGRP